MNFSGNTKQVNKKGDPSMIAAMIMTAHIQVIPMNAKRFSSWSIRIFCKFSFHFYGLWKKKFSLVFSQFTCAKFNEKISQAFANTLQTVNKFTEIGCAFAFFFAYTLLHLLIIHHCAPFCWRCAHFSACISPVEWVAFLKGDWRLIL